MNQIAFDHRQTAHCESGSFSSLLRHNGLDISEAMTFGISSAMSFAYIPFIKMGGMPLISYRMPPGKVIKGLTGRLGIKMKFERFRQRKAGEEALISHLNNNRPVGLQVSVYWLSYFPEDMRFHFNAHNIVAYGHDEGEFLISDPTIEEPVRENFASLEKARFVKGVLAPKGLIYYPTQIPTRLNMENAVRSAMIKTTRIMLQKPIPIVGVRGIRFVSGKIRNLAKQHDTKEAHNKLYIGHMIRMQEEIGTGGGGFRFLYAAFLQEAAGILGNESLKEVSSLFTDTGDEWRRFALFGAKMIKGRMEMDYNKLADQLLLVADMEENCYRQLYKAIK